MTTDRTQPLKIAALIGGGGRTLLNIADHIDRGVLNARVVSVIASKATLTGVTRATQRGFDVHVAGDPKQLGDAAVQDQIWKWIEDAGVELVCLCGWLRWLRIDPPWEGRVMNIHPALLPAFGGRGMYGMAVHRAVLAAGRSFSGCTVHFVDEHYDHGPIIVQRACRVLPDDTPDDLAGRVFAEECIAYPQAIRMFADGLLHARDGRVVITAGSPHEAPAGP